MPLNQTFPTISALNGANFTSPSGQADLRTNNPEWIGLVQGDYFDLTTTEALQLSATATGTLYSGRYRYVKVDSGATAANVKTGTIGLMPSLAAIGNGTSVASPSENVVTSYDQGLATGLHPVVFLNSITPGNYGFVQEQGVATVLGTAAIQKASPAIGDLINSAASGLADDPTTQTVGPLYIGKAIDLPKPGVKYRVQLQLPVVQG